ncbi:MAG: DUF4416 family protein [bacterium]|nr:DUF4416 family protein [bacterium]
MGILRPPRPVKLIASIFSHDISWLQRSIEELSRDYGNLDFISEILSFDKTDYYSKEMGENLKRRFLSFEVLFKPEVLKDIKLYTNRLEKKYADKGKRRVNIDPGYLSLGALILASTKEAAYRPYLGKGIYADLTLIYNSGGFQGLDWTYPDYLDVKVIHIMNQIREKYKFQLKEGKNRP